MDPVLRGHLVEGERLGMKYSLLTPREAVSGPAGYQLSSATGSSLDFKDFRDYQPGDDIRRIDWSVYARSDKLIIKRYREETCPHVDILLDCSCSMALEGSEKARCLLGIAALLAAAAGNAGSTFKVWKMADGIVPVANGMQSPSNWDGIDFDYRLGMSDSVGRSLPLLKRQGMRIILGDLLCEGDPLSILRPLADGAAAVTLIQIFGQSDEDPGEVGDLRVLDCESEERMEVFVDAAAIAAYREAFIRHQQNWYRACRQVGAALLTMQAESVVDTWDLSQLESNGIIGAA